MKKKSNKKYLVFGLPLLAIVLVSAGLLSYFGVITITADVLQSVTVDGKTGQAMPHIIPEAAPGGESFCFLHKVKNDASIDIPVKLENEITGPSGCNGIGETQCKAASPTYCNWENGKCVESGITTTMYEVPETTTLHLESKDTSWKVDSRMKADLTFKTMNPTFNWSLSAVSGLQTSTPYAIIYYGDFNPRFTTWGGNNPGKIIATFTTDTSGTPLTTSGSVDLGMNLPSSLDWNINPSPDYCLNHNSFDSYAHCKGAKIWIVPTSDLTSNDLPLKVWNPSSYLFETDLITYSDCTEPAGPNFAVDMVKGALITTSLGTKSKTTTPVLVCYDFDKLIAPGTYTITTTVVPAA